MTAAPPVHDSPILVVDDSAFDRDLVAGLLRRAGFTRVETAGGGEQALRRLRRSSPDLVLLDLVMPGLGGIEVLARLRAEPRLARLPVLVLTSLSSPEDRNLAFERGATDVVAKPVDPVELVARVRIQLEYRALAMALRADIDRREAEAEASALALPVLQPDPAPAVEGAARAGGVIRLRAAPGGMRDGEAWAALAAGAATAVYRLACRDGVLGALALHRLAAEARDLAADPAAWLGAIGAGLAEVLGAGALAEGACAFLDPAAGRLAWAAAGRAGAWSAGGAVPPSGPPLGSGAGAYRAASLDLPPGGLAALGPAALPPGPAHAQLAVGDADRALAGLADLADRGLGQTGAGRPSLLVLGRAR